MDIEEVAESDPEAIARLHVDPLVGFQDFHGRRLAFEAGVDADVIRPVGAMLAKLYDAFVAEEAMLVEVNPLIVTGEREVMALDAKVTVDDNALFRQPEIAELRNPSAEDPQEQMAKRARHHLRQARRRHRHPRQRRRARDVDARRRRPGGRRARELPRRRRRREGRGDRRARRGAALRRQGQGRAVQHLRRHHPLRRGRARASSRRSTRSSRRCRSSCGSTAPTTRRAAQLLAEAEPARTCTARRRCCGAAAKVVELAERRR